MSLVFLTLRMDAPPQSKPVPINLPGWAVFFEGHEDSNIFSNSQLLMDRPLGLQGLRFRVSHAYCLVSRLIQGQPTDVAMGPRALLYRASRRQRPTTLHCRGGQEADSSGSRFP